jgi:hypothetical protein
MRRPSITAFVTIGTDQAFNIELHQTVQHRLCSSFKKSPPPFFCKRCKNAMLSSVIVLSFGSQIDLAKPILPKRRDDRPVTVRPRGLQNPTTR